MKKTNDFKIWLLIIGAAVIWSMVEFALQYWYVITIIAAVIGAILYYGKNNNGVDEVQIQRLLEIYYESLELVNTSENIETVDSRFGVLEEVGRKLEKMPTNELDNFRAEYYRLDAEKIFVDAATRYLRRQMREISNLKTDKGVARRIEKIIGVINSLEHMPPNVKTQIIKSLE